MTFSMPCAFIQGQHVDSGLIVISPGGENDLALPGMRCDVAGGLGDDDAKLPLANSSKPIPAASERLAGGRCRSGLRRWS